MAKKNNDTIFNDFLADLKAINPKVEEILADEKVSAKLKDSVLARSEFSSQMDALKQRETEVNNYLAAEKQKIDGWQQWYGETSQQTAQMADALKKYEEEFGPLEQNGGKRPQNNGFSAEEFDKEMQRREGVYVQVMSDLADLKMEHRDRFKEKLDTGSVLKIAGEKGIPLDLAYKVFVAEKEEALQKSDFEEKLKSAREEGRKEALAAHNLPVVDSAPAQTHVLDYKDVHRNSADRVSAAVAAWRNRTT